MSTATGLKQLVTRGDLQRDLGISARQADHVFRQLPTTKFPGSRRVYVTLDDVQVFLRNYTQEPS